MKEKVLRDAGNLFKPVILGTWSVSKTYNILKKFEKNISDERNHLI